MSTQADKFGRIKGDLQKIVEKKTKAKKNEDPKVSEINQKLMEAYQEWSIKPSKEAVNKFVQASMPLLKRAVEAYGGSSKDPLHIGYAKQLAVRALAQYDPSKGTQPATYLWSRLQNLNRKISGEKNFMKIPERVVLAKNQMEALRKEMEDKLGRDPSDEELATEMGVDIKYIKRLRGLNNPMFSGSEYTVGTEDNSGSFSVRMPHMEKKRSEAVFDLVYNSLAPKEKVLMENLYGMNGRKPTTLSVAAKRAGMSVPTASRRWQEIRQQVQDIMNRELI